MLKQPTTTYAGEECLWAITFPRSHSLQFLTDFSFMLSIQSDVPFEGAYGNLKRLFDKAAKMYHQVKKQEMKKLSPSRQRWAKFKILHLIATRAMRTSFMSIGLSFYATFLFYILLFVYVFTYYIKLCSLVLASQQTVYILYSIYILFLN